MNEDVELAFAETRGEPFIVVRTCFVRLWREGWSPRDDNLLSSYVASFDSPDKTDDRPVNMSKRCADGDITVMYTIC